MADCNTVMTPLDPNVELIKSTNKCLTKTRHIYQQILGNAQYATIDTHFPICFALQHLAQFASNPGTSHLTATKRLPQYLAGTKDHALVFRWQEAFDLVGYLDADWAGNLSDRRSTSGFVFLLCSSLVTWSSKKQPTVALSSTEAEYMAVSNAARKVIWIRNILAELTLKLTTPTTLFVDNRGAIDMSKGDNVHAWSKHIDIHHHFKVCDCIDNHQIDVQHILSQDNIAVG